MKRESEKKKPATPCVQWGTGQGAENWPRRRPWGILRRGEFGLDRQIFGAQLFVFQNLGGGAVKDDAARVEDHRPVCQFQRAHRVLFDQNGGHALFLDVDEGLFDLVHDHRGKALRRVHPTAAL